MRITITDDDGKIVQESTRFVAVIFKKDEDIVISSGVSNPKICYAIKRLDVEMTDRLLEAKYSQEEIKEFEDAENDR